MSLATIDATKFSDEIRVVIDALLEGKIGSVLIPQVLTITVKAEQDHRSIAITWPERVEADLPGINPDLLRARCFADHAIIDMHLSNIRINY